MIKILISYITRTSYIQWAVNAGFQGVTLKTKERLVDIKISLERHPSIPEELNERE